MNYVIMGLVGLLIALGVWARHARLDWREGAAWSTVSMAQLEAHHRLAIAMADRVHLDPACRELLRHQVRVLKAVGVVGNREEEPIDITPEHRHHPVEGPKIKYSSIDDWNRAQGRRVQGDPETGFGLYEQEDHGA